MKKLSTNEIRRKWLDFFISKGHMEVESKSLIPVNDNSLLWINSGVATLKKFFSGEENPPCNRITNSQKCIRTNDIENVGVTSRHHTIFEMLGNFSIGDYFKEEAIEFAFELLTEVFQFDIRRLYITVYEKDEITYRKWIELGVFESHILKCNKERNFWDLGSGPCGPCTEIYYDRGEKYDPYDIGIKLFFDDIENDRYVEIWNIVFSEFNNINGKYEKLDRKNIDTGAGLERLASIIQDVPTDFDIDIFLPIIDKISNYTINKYSAIAYFNNDQNQKWINKNYRIIVDHFKASSFAIADGVIPSNKERGYILRKLIRRAKIALLFLDIKTNELINDIINSIIDSMKEYYPYLLENNTKIQDVINAEILLFEKTLKNSKAIFSECLQQRKISGEKLFHLVDTYGFPIEIIKEIEANKSFELLGKIFDFSDEENKILSSGIDIDFKTFEKKFDEHRVISKNKNDINTFKVQNKAFLNLDVESKYRYDIKKCQSKVVKIFDDSFKEVRSIKNKDCYVVLDVTCFYATSGGQVHDMGTINDYEVLDVIKGPNGQHIHKVKKGCFKLNEKVKAAIDWTWRRRCGINHTAEHLLHSALKAVIDKNIKQEGAFKSDRKLTFDFQYSKKITKGDIKKIEDFINKAIASQIPVEILYVNSVDEAKKMGAIAYFDEVYKKIKGKLRVVKIGDLSTELCAGTHIPNTKYIEQFKVIRYESKGSGSWRIEAITTNKSMENFKIATLIVVLNSTNEKIKRLTDLKIGDNDLRELLIQLRTKSENPLAHFDELMELKDKISDYYTKAMNDYNKKKELYDVLQIKEKLNESNSFISYIVISNFSQKAIQTALSEIINEKENTTFFVINLANDKIQFYGAHNAKTNKKDICALIKKMADVSNGKGGGKQFFAQGGTSDTSKLDDIVNVIENLYKN